MLSNTPSERQQTSLGRGQAGSRAHREDHREVHRHGWRARAQSHRVGHRDTIDTIHRAAERERHTVIIIPHPVYWRGPGPIFSGNVRMSDSSSVRSRSFWICASFRASSGIPNDIVGEVRWMVLTRRVSGWLALWARLRPLVVTISRNRGKCDWLSF